MLLDNRGGARAGVEHLLRHGHERIAFVGDPPELYTAQERLAGYRGALHDAGHDPDDALISTGSHDAASAERAVRELLALPPPARPTALFTANNRNTVGALRALRNADEQVALVGFDDFELADMLAVPVTVVRHDPAAMGASAPTSPTRASTARTAAAAAHDRLRGRRPRLRRAPRR